MNNPWIAVAPLEANAFASVRTRAIFDCHKWDPQIGDVCAIAPHPLVITRDAWGEVRALAEELATETLAAETELIHRPELHRRLGLSSPIRRALRAVRSHGAPAATARLMRFDFHFTDEGWRISEVNCDVPGGLNEASGLPSIMLSHYPWAGRVGDPADAYVQALCRHAGPQSRVAFIHATSYSDDQQMMLFLAQRVAGPERSVHLASPSHIRWNGGRAFLQAAWWQGPLDLVVRFFPADWLCSLPRASGWPSLFAGSLTPLSNPATAILTQSKRFPLVWDALQTRVPAWRRLLPETRDPRDVAWRSSPDWIIKPAFGRVGEGVGILGVTASDEMRQIGRAARFWPSGWVAQRRFHIRPIDMSGTQVFPCLGVYTLDTRVVGAYGRLAPVPLIDARAADAAVLAA